MNKKKILIDASGARTIGSLNNIKSLFDYIKSHKDNNLYIFIVSNNFLTTKIDRNENVKILQFNILKHVLKKRIFVPPDEIKSQRRN
mgnify:CR=1 FL=1